MATYATYRHIELDKVGYSKKRVRNPPSDIFNVMCTPPSANGKSCTPKRSPHNDSFNRLFGSPEVTPPRRLSLTKHDVTNRNPVTGNGVDSWDCRPASRNSPRLRTERNPVTGEIYTVVSPATTPTKPPVPNGFGHQNGYYNNNNVIKKNKNNNNNNNNNNMPVITNGNHESAAIIVNGVTANGNA